MEHSRLYSLHIWRSRKTSSCFSHPAKHKLYSVLKLARPRETIQETKDTRNEISRRCEPCQKCFNAFIRFRVFVPSEDNLVFGEELSIDIMHLEGKPDLHVIDTATHLSAATFLDSAGEMYGESVKRICISLITT